MPRQVTVDVGAALGAVRPVAGEAARAAPGGREPLAGQEPSAELSSREAADEAKREAQQLAQARRALLDAVSKVQQLQEKLLAEAESQLVDLALDAARKILVQEIQAERYEIEPIVRDALARAPARRGVIVRLHPEDFSACEMAQGGASAPDGAEVRFVADPGVGRAECVVETPEGVVETAMDGQLAQIGEQLKAVE